MSEARLRLERDGERIGRDRLVRLKRGERTTITFVDSLDSAGIVRYEAAFSASGGGRAAFVRAGDEPLIGVVGAAPAWDVVRPGRCVARW